MKFMEEMYKNIKMQSGEGVPPLNTGEIPQPCDNTSCENLSSSRAHTASHRIATEPNPISLFHSFTAPENFGICYELLI